MLIMVMLCMFIEVFNLIVFKEVRDFRNTGELKKEFKEGLTAFALFNLYYLIVTIIGSCKGYIPAMVLLGLGIIMSGLEAKKKLTFPVKVVDFVLSMVFLLLWVYEIKGGIK